jgi:putative FmdB family regulatory protein
MPTYEYRCEKCGHEFEREQRITEDPIKKCPKCSALKAKRMISATSFVLKGGGWYSDLYSSSGGKKEKKGEASPAGPASDSGSSGASSSSGSSGASSSSAASSSDAGASKSAKSPKPRAA